MPVSGKVTLDGAPLDHGVIRFSSLDSPPKEGATGNIQNGEYTIPADAGLMPGTYKVVISSQSGGGVTTTDPAEAMKAASSTAQPTERIPKQYNTESKEQVTVAKGSPTKFDYDLQSK